VIPIRVECYSGYKSDERPLRFTLGERVFEIVEIDDRWYSPDAIYFRVKADDGNIYLLRHDEIQNRWSLEAFRYR
jgi:hypothetical protein